MIGLGYPKEKKLGYNCYLYIVIIIIIIIIYSNLINQRVQNLTTDSLSFVVTLFLLFCWLVFVFYSYFCQRLQPCDSCTVLVI